MSVCAVCGEEDTLYKCKKCGISFCDYCGESEEKLCENCLEETEDAKEDP